MKNLLMMVGIPLCGKSWYIENNFNKENYYIISNTDIRNKICKDNGLTFDDSLINPDNIKESKFDYNFNKNIERLGEIKELTPVYKVYSKVMDLNTLIQSEFTKTIKNAASQKKDIIVDLTNSSYKSRNSLINSIGIQKKHITVYDFHQDLNLEELNFYKFLSKIVSAETYLEGNPKTLQDSMLERFYSEYKKPKIEDGYKKIINVDNLSALKIHMNKYLEKYIENYDVDNDLNIYN